MRLGTSASLALLALFLVVWEWGPGFVNIPPYIIPPASSVLDELIRAIQRERLIFHTGITALETGVGFLVGSLL